MESCNCEAWGREIGDPSLLCESPLEESCTWAANCKFHRTSSTEGLSVGSLERHLTHISITVFKDSSKEVPWTAGSAMLLRADSSAATLASNCHHNKYDPYLYKSMLALHWSSVLKKFSYTCAWLHLHVCIGKLKHQDSVDHFICSSSENVTIRVVFFSIWSVRACLFA